LSTVPPGFLLCDGREVSRSLYFRLFQIIGTTYGAGDGVNSFNLPNLQKQFVKGVTVSAMQSTAGTSVPSKTSFLGAAFSYNLGVNVSESQYTNPTGITTTNLIPYSGQSSSAGEHSHS
jgi:microcystin-dependent protein